MVLKELIIRNFRSYYGDSNRFDFNPEGLTLIIGDNGDGKTTFFEALEWLFDTTGLREKEEINNVSEMRKSINTHSEKIVAIEASAKQAHRRLDTFEQRLWGETSRKTAAIEAAETGEK